MSEFPLQVSLTAGYQNITVLDQIEFQIVPCESFGLIGTSGAGKSTLVMALLGLLPMRGGWAKGEILVNGRNILALPGREARQLRGREIALIPQSPLSALNSAISVQVHFDEAWRAHQGSRRSDLKPRLDELMRQMQLPSEASFLARRPDQISVGQAQRVAIALALLHRPSILIADEPTSSLDPVTASEMLSLLSRISSEDGTSILLVSHDLLSVVMLCQRMAVLHKTRIVEVLSLLDPEVRAQHPASLELLSTLPASLSSIRRIRAFPALLPPK